MVRSKEFEENEVLDKVMKLFWEQGYEKMLMSDFVEYMGIYCRSIYDMFIDKCILFFKVMEWFGNCIDVRLVVGVK